MIWKLQCEKANLTKIGIKYLQHTHKYTIYAPKGWSSRAALLKGRIHFYARISSTYPSKNHLKFMDFWLFQCAFSPFTFFLLLLLSSFHCHVYTDSNAPAKGVFTTPAHEPVHVHNAYAGSFFFFFARASSLLFCIFLPTVLLKWLLNSLWFHLKSRAANTWLIIFRHY